MVEGVRRGREHLKDTKRPAEVTQGGYQNRAHSKVPTSSQIHSGVEFSVRAKHHFSGAHTVSRQSAIRLQAAADIGGGTAGAGTTDDLVSPAQGNCRASGSGQRLGF